LSSLCGRHVTLFDRCITWFYTADKQFLAFIPVAALASAANTWPVNFAALADDDGS